MRKHKILRLCMFTVLLISVTTIIYSGYQILYSGNAIEKSIKEWDSLKAGGTEKDGGNELIEEDRIKDEKPQEAENPQSVKKIDLYAKLIIESSQEEIPVVKGVSLNDLRYGAGYFPQSAQPGQVGNCIILGHRENVFRNLGRLKLQDKIVIESLDKKYVYRVVETQIVDKINDNLLDPVQDARLTLITCYPIQYTGPAEQRYLVTAKLE